MNSDDFEQRLQRQPLRSLPTAWRTELLREANHCLAGEKVGKGARGKENAAVTLTVDSPSLPFSSAPFPSFLPTPSWREWLWPCPQAWAGLAAAWMLIVGLHLSTRDAAPVTVRRVTTSPLQLRQAMQEKLQLLAELNPPGEAVLAEPPKPFRPKPRSECRPTTGAC